MEPNQPFTFIKTADMLQEDHELFSAEIEETIEKLGLPYNFAMALRISQAKVSEETKNTYIEEMKEKQKTIVEEQAELQKRFAALCEDMIAKEEYDKKLELAKEQEDVNVILADPSKDE